MNPTNDSLKILPKSTERNAHITFHSNSQNDFSYQTNKDHQWIVRPNFKSMSMTDMNSDFHQEPRNYSSNMTLTSEDEDGREIFSNTKSFIDQGSQVILEELKSKKKKKTDPTKKTKSSPKRIKQTNSLQIPPATSVSNRINSTNDLTTPLKAPGTAPKSEESSTVKRLITVDTSKARSNLEVVRLCIRELGWKEVEKSIKIFHFNLSLIPSVQQIHLSIQISIGIHLHFTKDMQTSHLIPVELINFLVNYFSESLLLIFLYEI